MDKLKSIVKSVWANDYVRRVLHTYWQSFLAAWALTGFKLEKAALIAAAAAALSAVKAALVARS
jgi:hypothetical protein